MKTCPACQREYADEEMKYCLDDGSLLTEKLVATAAPSDDMRTWQMPGHSVEPPPTLVAPTAPPLRTPPVTHPTAASFSVAPERRRSGALLWIALALIVGGSGIAIALIVTRARQTNSNADLALTNSAPNQNASSAEATPTIDSDKSVASQQSSPTNRATEKPTPLSRSTPLSAGTGNIVSAPPKVDTVDAPPAAPPKAAPPKAPISGGVLNGRAIRLVQPSYPAIARSAHASGQVTVRVVIDENGNVISASAVSGHPLLQASAVAAARQSKFTPTKLSGQAVKVTGVIIYNFVAQ